ncbi:TadE/TadG family type IV pilus assembly protein [Atopobium fossor]|uniref:TadE/TadG family type IV pilus assembly protein n=1 Tax=Atopobium fossor TaxID=39487 RepID=UPI0003F8BBC2|nr:TadE/TadG family type IV pilus assembly protein [Atopobium fossor]
MNVTTNKRNYVPACLRAPLRFIARGEEGQSFVEFALIVSVMCLLAFVPIDLVRYASLRMALNDATAASLSNVNYESLTNGTYQDNINASLKAAGQGKLNDLHVESIDLGAAGQESYTYRVYSSDKEQEGNFSNRFEDRPSNYSYQTITVRTQCQGRAITPLGALFTGGMDWTITSDSMSRNVYASGYKE